MVSVLKYRWVFKFGMCFGVFGWCGLVKVVVCLKVVVSEIKVVCCKDFMVVVEGCIVLIVCIWFVFEYIDMLLGFLGIVVYCMFE